MLARPSVREYARGVGSLLARPSVREYACCHPLDKRVCVGAAARRATATTATLARNTVLQFVVKILFCAS